MGYVYFCPKCGIGIYSTDKSPIRGEPVHAGDFHSLVEGVSDPKTDDPAVCPLCHADLTIGKFVRKHGDFSEYVRERDE